MKHFRKISHRSLAGFLMIWLSGAVFLFCCEMAAAERLEEEFCPLSKAHSHCDKNAAVTDSNAFSGRSADFSFDCCAFLPIVFEKTRTIEKVPQAAPITPKLKIERHYLSNLDTPFEISSNYHSTVLPRNDLFLRNCYFRL